MRGKAQVRDVGRLLRKERHRSELEEGGCKSKKVEVRIEQ